MTRAFALGSSRPAPRFQLAQMRPDVLRVRREDVDLDEVFAYTDSVKVRNLASNSEPVGHPGRRPLLRGYRSR